jgi:hypothetical protein
MVLSVKVMSQSPEKDFVIVGMVSGDMNMIQIQMRYEGAQDAFFIKESSISGIEQIANALEGLKINDLHVFAKSNGKDLFLTDLPITTENVNDFTVQLKRWKKSISGKVVVHNNTGNQSSELNNLLVKMKELTQLEFKLTQ